MAKTENDIREKKEKKEKKRKAEEEGEDVSAKKDKKKKRKSVDAEGDAVMDVSVVEAGDDEVVATPKGALVPFANPLADDKQQKKVMKAVKKSAKNKALKRGVKECVKAIRKSPVSLPSANGSAPGIVILAADISPMDVISHIPVLCEDHNIPYLYVESRAELGAAGSTKRPTSVVMITPQQGKGADKDAEKEWNETYDELYKLAIKMGQTVKV
ncbi:hypothetical protein WHR41_02201 [Cladosporium halotolerans]|uniref:H/ACA ribonucleoprotein complex subunit 2 n=1 Tax=Cladosporium halotolerans TaxID=1052096 RepID=A0AB34L1L8_9PEZI